MRDQSRITWRDRALALVALFVIGSVCVGAKSAILSGLFLTIASVVHAIAAGMRPGDVPTRWFVRGPIVHWVAFGIFATCSAVWALSARASVEAGVDLVFVVLTVGTLVLIWSRLGERTATLISGWTAIGFVISLAISYGDLVGGNVLTAWFLEHFDVTGRGGATWVRRNAGSIVAIAPELWNWNVAGANLLLWPMLLLMTLVGDGRFWKAMLLVCSLLAVAVTLQSVHATSLIALGVGAVLFVLAKSYPRTAVGLVMTGFVVSAVAVAPLVTYAHSTLRLHHATWVPRTLQARFVIWNHTAEQIPQAPLIGIGANSTKYWRLRNEIARKRTGHWQDSTVNNHAHNYFLQAWFELGALGALLFTAAGLSTLKLISSMQSRAQPFAVATAGTAMTMFSATWNLWHLWLVAAVGIGMAFLTLGNTLAAQRLDRRVLFHQLWLPERWIKRLA